MKQTPIAGGYRFEGVSSDGSSLTVRWSLQGLACPEMRVGVINCASPLGLARLQLDVPATLAARCPELQAVAADLSYALRSEHPVGQYRSLPPRGVPALVVVACLLIAAGLAIRRLLAPAGHFGPAWGDGAWIVLVVVTITPFLGNIFTAVTLGLGLAWFLFAGLLAYPDHVPQSRRFRLLLLVLFGFSLALNASLSSRGPGDLHLNLSAIWSSDLELRWGPAPVSFFRLLRAALGSVRDSTIIWCNLIVGSLIPVLLCMTVRAFGIREAAALVAGFVVAAHPFLIALTGVLERQPLYLFAATGSVLALVEFLHRGTGRWLGAFAIGAVLAVTSRPEGAQVLVVYLAVWLVVPARARVKAAAAIVLGVLIAFALAYTEYALELKVPGASRSVGAMPFWWTILLAPDFTPLAWIVLWVVGLIIGWRQRAAWIGWATVLGLDLLWRWSPVYLMIVGHERQVASARYESILLIPFAIGVALCIDTVLATGRRLRAALILAGVVLTAVTWPRPFDVLLQPFTVDYEYRFLAQYASALPPGSRIYVVDPPFDDMGFIDAHRVGMFVQSAVAFAYWSERQCEDFASSPGDTYLYVGSACAALLEAPDRPLREPDYGLWMADCDAIRAAAAGGLIETIDVPARKMSWHAFKHPTVALALYRIDDPSLCAIGPKARRGVGVDPGPADAADRRSAP